MRGLTDGRHLAPAPVPLEWLVTQDPADFLG
jgi:hypothetical protein